MLLDREVRVVPCFPDETGANRAGRLADQKAGQKTSIRRHRVGHEGPCHSGLCHQVNGEPPPGKRERGFTLPGAPGRVSLPKVVQRCESFLPIILVHCMPPQELPTFIGEDPKAGVTFMEFAGQPLIGRFRHRAVGGHGRSGLQSQRFEVGKRGSPRGAFARLRLGQDVVPRPFPKRQLIAPTCHFETPGISLLALMSAHGRHERFITARLPLAGLRDGQDIERSRALAAQGFDICEALHGQRGDRQVARALRGRALPDLPGGGRQEEERADLGRRAQRAAAAELQEVELRFRAAPGGHRY